MTIRSARPIAAIALLAAGAVALAGCGSSGGGAASTGAAGSTKTPAAAPELNPAGDIPDNQAFVTYTPTTGGFTVQYPEGWARSTDAAGATVFADKYNRVTVSTASAPAAPTVTSVTGMVIPSLQTSPGFSTPKVSTVTRKSGSAILLTYRADSAANSVTNKKATLAVERYAFWRAGRTVVLTLSAPVGSDNVDPWRTVTDSFRWSA